jgi:hypothetical protein
MAGRAMRDRSNFVMRISGPLVAARVADAAVTR